MAKKIKLRLSKLILLCVCIVLSGLIFLTPQRAQIRTEATDPIDQLVKAAETNGSVSVIVGLKSDFTPEGDLTLSRRVEQRTKIESNKAPILSKLEALRSANIKAFERIPYFAATVDADALEFLRSQPEVASIRQQVRLTPDLAESTAVIGATTAWSLGFNGAGSVVAILDTGVDKTHLFFNGKVISEGCFSTTSVAEGTTSVCPGGASSSTASDSGLNCTFTGSCSHGTHVAGIAAGQLPSSPLQGVARGANVVAIQVFSRVTANNAVNAFDADIISALERVMALKQAGMNIAAANLSLGDGERYTSNCDDLYPDMKAAIDNLRSVGVATVFSAGNNGYTNGIGFPGCISTAVSTGSTGDGGGGTITDLVSSFSNSSSFMSLFAPGQVITSSVPGGAFSGLNGTSMAAPHVTGAFAILRQKYPNATVAQLLEFLKASGQPVTDARNGVIKPRIDIAKALCYSSIATGQTINGALANADCSLSTGPFYDAYAFTATAGQRISVLMTGGFDVSLRLIGPSGETIAQDNDGGGGTNARIPATSGYFALPLTGVYSIYATSTPNGATGNYSLNLATAPLASLSGKVTTPDGLGLRNAGVTLTDQGGSSRRVTTSSFGVFQFDNVAVGEAYFIGVASKRYRFETRSVLVDGNLTNIDFIGLQ